MWSLLLIATTAPALWCGAARLGSGQRKKTRADRLLDNPVRRRIVETIQRLKGLNTTRLGKEAGVARGTLRHHLRFLEQGGVVRKIALGREAHFFVEETDVSKADVLARLRHGRSWSVLEQVLRDPGVRQNVLCVRLGMTRQVLGRHLKILVEGQLVQQERAGRMRRYYPGRSVDNGIWSLFGLTRPARAEVSPRSLNELRAAWSTRRGPWE